MRNYPASMKRGWPSATVSGRSRSVRFALFYYDRWVIAFPGDGANCAKHHDNESIPPFLPQQPASPT